MRAIGLVLLAGTLAATAVGLSARQDRTVPVDRAFAAFWLAADRSAAAERIGAVVKSGVSYPDALSRIQQGRTYVADVPRGLQKGRHRTFDGVEHPYAFVIPKTYDPARAWPVRVYLHGGVGRRATPTLERVRVDTLPGTVEEISVFPTSWADSEWWSAAQADNLARILDRLKRQYNVDENRVYLTGTSDGGTGAYFMAFHDGTPWASFVPLIGQMTVLASAPVESDGDVYPGNAVNKPFLIVNGGRDPLYPAELAEPFVRHLETLGTPLIFHVYPESGHSTAWWPEERDAFEAFVREHPRQPLPDRLSWETDRTDRYNRLDWLVIDRLGSVAGESRLTDTNLMLRGPQYDFGLRVNSSVERGRRVEAVVAGSNAFAIGLRAGDRLVECDGAAIESGSDLSQAMQRWPMGAAVSLVVEREGQRIPLDGRFNPSIVDVPPATIFPRHRASGRVDVVRRGNLIEASTQGVQAFTLLLSPSMFDFGRKVTVVANGRTVVDGIVEPSVATMLKWAARDNDRTMAFGAELRIDLMH